jgi:Tol biopolymer transport system component
MLRAQRRVAQADEWRQIAHSISSEIYQLCTGDKRDFE